MYLLNSDAFIQAKNTWFDFDLCPGFWDWLDRKFRDGIVVSISNVASELVLAEDELADWVEKRRGFFFELDEKSYSGTYKVSEWMDNQLRLGTFLDAAVHEFLDTDLYIVGHAKAHRYTIVTQQLALSQFEFVRIPDVCNGLNIRYMSISEMLRQEGARFLLDPQSP